MGTSCDDPKRWGRRSAHPKGGDVATRWGRRANSKKVGTSRLTVATSPPFFKKSSRVPARERPGGGGRAPAGRPKLRNLVRAGSAGLPSRPRAWYTAVLLLNTIAYSRSALCTSAWELGKLKFRKSWEFHRNLKEIPSFLEKMRKAAAEQSRWCLQLGSLSTIACTLHTCRPAARRTAK